MPEYLAPGVYVEERDTGSKPIEGVSTSTAGMLGVTERGPVNVPILVTSSGDYSRWFGGTLNPVDYSNALGKHCYLPHAVDGFFRNGGKRLYVTRVLDRAGAQNAETNLFGRGDRNSADTIILRAADEDTGTAANIPALYVLDVTDLSNDDWIRLGGGSKAEYRQIDTVGNTADATHVALNFPLSFSHASGVTVEIVNGGVDGAYNDIFEMNTETERGASIVEIVAVAAAPADAEADISLLESNVNGGTETFLQFGDDGEFHRVSEVTITGATTARITLNSRLARDYEAGASVRPMDTGGTGTSDILDMDAAAGARLIYLQTQGHPLTNRTDLVLVDHADAENREVRRIGDIYSLTLAGGAFEGYGAGSVVESTMLADDTRTTTDDPAPSDTSFDLDDVSSLVVGQQLRVGTNDPAAEETVSIQSISGNTVTVASGLANDHNNGDTVVPVAKQTTMSAAAGTSVIALDNRLGLEEGDVLRIGQAPDDEYVVIAAINNATGTAPDNGNVVLEQNLVNGHADGTEVQRQIESGGGQQPTVLVSAAESGGNTLYVTDGDGYGSGEFVRVHTSSGEVFYHRLSGADDLDPASVTLTTVLDRAHIAGAPLVNRDPLIEVQALDPGIWGNRLRIAVEDEEVGLVAQTSLTGTVNPTTIELASLAGIESGTVLELRNPADDTVVGAPVKVDNIDRSEGTATIANPLEPEQQNTLAVEGSLLVRSREFRLSVFLLRQPDPAMPSRNDQVIGSEVFRHLSMDHRHSRYIHTVVGTTWTPGSDNDDDGNPLRKSDRRSEGESGYIRVRDLANTDAEREGVRLGPEALIDMLPDGREVAARREMDGGDDAMSTLSDNVYVGSDDREPENRTGIYTFRNVQDISIVAVPGNTRQTVQKAVINHCENERYRFAVLDADQPPRDSMNAVQAQRQNYDTKYAALYHPWLQVPEPYPANLAKISDYAIPPSGHMVGIYARTDVERGVHKAPANEVVRGITGLERTLNKGEHDILNPKNINVIRDFRSNNRGLRVWGARVMTSDPDWKYVNVRRLLIFIEHSIDRGLQWVVFEPNAHPLWARVRRSVSNFLTTVWRNGALEGKKVEEAFYVKCDRTTMTQTDIDNGRLICEIGVAPVKPAEFVIVRIGLWTAHAEE